MITGKAVRMVASIWEAGPETASICKAFNAEITIGIMGNIFISGFVQKNNTSTSEIFVLSYSQEGVLLANVMSELSDYDLVLPQFIFTDENGNEITFPFVSSAQICFIATMQASC